MLQVRTFALPSEVEAANEFLRTHRPEGTINFNRDTLIIFYENGVDAPEYEIAELRGMLVDIRHVKFSQNLILHTMENDLADLKERRSHLNSKHNKGEYEGVVNAIAQTEIAIANTKLKLAAEDNKAEFVQNRINELLGTNR